MIKLFDSMSKTKKQLTKTNHVNLYLCGPTVYNYIHVGNARPVIVVDVLHRWLVHQKYQVHYVHNITDIDDKIINEAQKQKMTEPELANKYYLAYVQNLQTLNILLPTTMPKVSAFIPDMINFIQDLIANGSAYVSGHDVYFKIATIKSYGALANKTIEQLIPNFRVTNSQSKQSPFDFVLWKHTKTGLQWDSPWGSGRPGWHTECVVFIQKLFGGQTINFHGGGIDLKFPHHENERAQFLARNNKELADIWWHNGHVNFNNEKMSKSLNNVILVHDFCQQYGPMPLRYLILNHDHQQPINFTDDVVTEAKNTIKKYHGIVQLWSYHNFIQGINAKKQLPYHQKYYQTIADHLNDNVNTTNVLTTINYMIKDLNQAIKSQDFTEPRQAIFKTLEFAYSILGFNFAYGNYAPDVQLKIKEWEMLKKQKAFGQADAVRNELQALGVLPNGN